MENSAVYVKTDDQSRVLAIDGGYTTPKDLTGWTKIDEGYGDRYNLCQSNYLPAPLYTEDGIPCYKLVDGNVVEREQTELEADRTELPSPVPSDAERLDALEAAMLALMMGGESYV